MRFDIIGSAEGPRLFVNPLSDAVPLVDKPQLLLIDALDEVTHNGKNQLVSYCSL